MSQNVMNIVVGAKSINIANIFVISFFLRSFFLILMVKQVDTYTKVDTYTNIHSSSNMCNLLAFYRYLSGIVISIFYTLFQCAIGFKLGF